MNDYGLAGEWLSEAKNVIVLAGAGMSLDSGLPAFRTGANALYKSFHPALKGRSFQELASPHSFDMRDEKRVRLAWAFYYTRWKLYKSVEPHEGYQIITNFFEKKNGFIYTTNGDGLFLRAGFKDVYEVHGSINHLQCSQTCCEDVWEAELDMEVNDKTFLVESGLPTCKFCGSLARPNILMFGDERFAENRHDKQFNKYFQFTRALDGDETLCIEIGAGQAVPTCRIEYSYHLGGEDGVRLLRINPGETDSRVRHPDWQVPIQAGCLEALQGIQAAL